ncbi:unnamed protein product [Linum trigynum]|uniref:TLC domain-containing protein n=1 Tax=Linum trigynum TaxID=586398 RepID=A0AAV2CVI3_9ROSI
MDSLNFSTCLALFLSIYLFAYLVLFRNWGSKHRAEASSSFMSLSHGTPAVLLAVRALLTGAAGGAPPLAAPNSEFQNSVLDFSTAYFVADLLHYLAFSPSDVLFILHHLATLYVFLTCRFLVGRGAYGLLELLILAEATSACQNVWSIARFRKGESAAAARLYEFLSPFFYVFYSVVRGVLAPIFIIQMVAFFAGGEGRGLIPAWVWVSWMVVIVAAIAVSVMWVSSHWVGWCKERGFWGRRSSDLQRISNKVK